VNGTPIQILLIEDNEADARLATEALKAAKVANCIDVVHDGEQALEYLRCQGAYATAPRPDLILLDLNMPRKNGRQVLMEVKSDPDLRNIPVVVLTSSSDDEDVVKSYDLHANCYIVKPVSFDGLLNVVKSLDQFWLSVVCLPPSGR
jgi:two-component system, chemotaxis family, response regulator Rcp1